MTASMSELEYGGRRLGETAPVDGSSITMAPRVALERLTRTPAASRVYGEHHRVARFTDTPASELRAFSQVE
jgi:hypothetical protein